MPVDIKTTGVHHVALRSSNLERSRKFYTNNHFTSSSATAPRRRAVRR